MFKNKKLLAICITIVILVVFGSFFYKNKDELYINHVLSSENYSYLPKEAKKYIKEIYKETGEVILTEKNKKYNTPYLNPMYEKYLSMSEEEKKEMDIIPNPYQVDFIENDFVKNVELPNSFDLRNVNNDVYITPLKNQKSTGLCWAFSMAEHMESYLMVKAKEPYDASTTKLISPRQIDYATSTNGIKNYENEFASRNLLEGGNFTVSSEIASYGLSFVEENEFPFNESSEKKELYEVLNFSASDYEVNDTVEIPTISRTMTLDDRCS